jgi:hypothetical protein
MKASLKYVQILCPQCEKEGFHGYVMNWSFDCVCCMRLGCALFRKKFKLPEVVLEPFKDK